MVEPSRLRLTRTPSIVGSWVEVTWPLSAAGVWAFAANALNRTPSNANRLNRLNRMGRLPNIATRSLLPDSREAISIRPAAGCRQGFACTVPMTQKQSHGSRRHRPPLTLPPALRRTRRARSGDAGDVRLAQKGRRPHASRIAWAWRHQIA